MAKKFAAIDGFHTIYSKLTDYIEGETRDYYDIEGTPLNDLVNHNTVCFVTADNTDVDVYVADHKIKAGDKFIIVQNDIFAYYTDSESNFENTWRPIYVNNEELYNTGMKLNFVDGEGTSVSSIVDYTNEQLTIAYNVNFDSIVNEVINQIFVPNVNDGALDFELKQSPVHTEEGGNPRDIDITPNTISLTCTHIEEQEDPQNPEQTISEEVEGNFTANTPIDSTVKIHYKGTADRVDWYVEGETRNLLSPNNTNAKKFVYVEGLSQYFTPNSQPPYVKLKSDSQVQKVISQDSIVFITCALGDADNFENEEYYAGAHFIWTQGRMFSANTWMPIFTRETESSPLKGITPPIENSPHGGRLIFQGRGGIIVDSDSNDHDATGNNPWEHERIITIDGSGISGGGGTGGKIYDTNVYIKTDILLGGTLLGDDALEEELFKDQGDKVPAEMTLHEVLQRLLYKERPASPYYFGVVGPYEDIITFTYGGDYTSEIDGNVVPNKSNTLSDATSAFIKISRKITDETTIDITPNGYFKTSSSQVPQDLQSTNQFIVAVPKDEFNTSLIINGYEWLTVLDRFGANNTVIEPPADLVTSFTEIVINNTDYYVWNIHSTSEYHHIYDATGYNVTFNCLK